MKRSNVFAAIFIVSLLIVMRLFSRVLTQEEQYGYNSENFFKLLDESYKENASEEAKEFYAWMEQVYKDSSRHVAGKENLKFGELLKAEASSLSGIQDVSEKTQAEISLCAWLHGLIKEIIPKFNLDTGYEFYNVVKLGERQCLLQSVLIAGILQEMGMNAGVVMVYKSMQGRISNNGHAVTLVKLPDGTDVLVDASDKEPFASHQGLFARVSDYAYVEPVYEENGARIISYVSVAKNEAVSAGALKPLDFSFIQSQFWYYRGERANGGVFSKVKTSEGLKASERALSVSVKMCPYNPLSVYMLGRVYLLEKNFDMAQKQFGSAAELYAKYGWVPDGLKDAVTLLQKTILEQKVFTQK